MLLGSIWEPTTWLYMDSKWAWPGMPKVFE